MEGTTKVQNSCRSKELRIFSNFVRDIRRNSKASPPA